MIEEYIRKQIEDCPINWYKIAITQKLSEDFIREFKDKVNWCYISECKKLFE